MAGLSITTAWNETVQYLKLHFGALFTIALAFIALPSVAMQAFGPAAAVTPGAAPEPGLWPLLLLVVLILNIVASLAMSSLALGRRTTVGEAIAHGFRRCLPMLVAVILPVAAMLLVFLSLAALSGLSPEDFTTPTPARAGRVLLVMLLFLAIGLCVAARLLLVMTPVAASERAGPVAIIKRSWSLTGGHFWKLLGFVVLMLIVLIVVTMVITIILGLLIAAVSGPPLPGTTGGFVLALVGALISAALAVVTTTIIARIYVQLSGGASGGASAAPPTTGI